MFYYPQKPCRRHTKCYTYTTGSSAQRASGMYSYKVGMIVTIFSYFSQDYVRNKLCYVKYGGQLTTCMMSDFMMQIMQYRHYLASQLCNISDNNNTRMLKNKFSNREQGPLTKAKKQEGIAIGQYCKPQIPILTLLKMFMDCSVKIGICGLHYHPSDPFLFLGFFQ